MRCYMLSFTLRLAHNRQSINVLYYCSYAKEGRMAYQTSLTLTWDPILGSTLCQLRNMAGQFSSVWHLVIQHWQKREVQQFPEELIPRAVSLPPGFQGSPALRQGWTH